MIDGFYNFLITNTKKKKISLQNRSRESLISKHSLVFTFSCARKTYITSDSFHVQSVYVHVPSNKDIFRIKARLNGTSLRGHLFFFFERAFTL